MLAEVGKRSYYDEKNRYWMGVLYPENMREDWKEEIAEILQRPFCYCIHDKDANSPLSKDEHDRKAHVHLWVVWGGPTTGKNAAKLFDRLSAPGKSCMRAGHEIESVQNPKKAYEYLIHEDERSIKDGKHRYDISERISGNNFDIGSYIVLSESEIKQMRGELISFCIQEKVSNFADLIILVRENYDDKYEDIICKYQAVFNSITKGNYLKSVKFTQDQISKKVEEAIERELKRMRK